MGDIVKKLRSMVERKRLEKFPDLSTYKQLGINGPTLGDLDSYVETMKELRPLINVELWNRDLVLYKKAEKIMTRLENVVYSPASKRTTKQSASAHKKRLNIPRTRVHRGSK